MSYRSMFFVRDKIISVIGKCFIICNFEVQIILETCNSFKVQALVELIEDGYAGGLSLPASCLGTC